MKNFLKVLILTACISFLTPVSIFAEWVQINEKQWQYISEGSAVANSWINDNGDWYFTDNNGLIYTDTTMKIDGAYYTFDKNGRWVEGVPELRTGVQSWVYTNKDFRYSINMLKESDCTLGDSGIKMKGERYFITISNFVLSQETMDAHSETYYEEFAAMLQRGEFLERSREDVQISDFTFRKTHFYNLRSTLYADLYFTVQKEGIIVILGVYPSEREVRVNNSINSLTKYR